MLSIDLFHAIENTQGVDNFHTQLFKLLFKADRQNFSKLSVAYPLEAAMVKHYRETGEIKETTIDIRDMFGPTSACCD